MINEFYLQRGISTLTQDEPILEDLGRFIFFICKLMAVRSCGLKMLFG